MKGRVVIVGLGAAGPELMTVAAIQALSDTDTRYVRTLRHPAALAVDKARSFDDLYDSASNLDDVYEGIVEELVHAAHQHGTVLYAVPGSPMVAERTVEMLIHDERVESELIAGISFLDLAFVRLGVDPIAQSVRIVDGHKFAIDAANERGPMLVAQCDAPWVMSNVKLALDSGEGPAVTVLQRLGLPDESIATVEWNDLDRAITADHLTTIWIPEMAQPIGMELARFGDLVRTLRIRCPWDAEQTHESLIPNLLEEANEVVETIEKLGDPDGYERLEDELGDLLMQVFMHATLAAEEGQFNIADVARAVHEKMVRRHPHVFGDAKAESAQDVMRIWEEVKRKERESSPHSGNRAH